MADDDLQHHLETSVIARPLLNELDERERSGREQDPLSVVVDLNADFEHGQDAAAEQVIDLIRETSHAFDGRVRHRTGRQFLVAELPPPVIRRLADIDMRVASGDRTRQAIHRIWPDFEVAPLLDRTGATVKADAAKISYAARGRGIVWAVLDSGIQHDHPHFAAHKNVVVDSPLKHEDFTGRDTDPLVDPFGHGTHVAGIIAGRAWSDEAQVLRAVRSHRDSHDDVFHAVTDVEEIEGISPETRLLSYKVLDDNGKGRTTPILEALDAIQRANSYGRTIKIHGVNLSVGYGFDPEWFACGQSPICQEVDRLVRSGVVVVVAAGNTGYAESRDLQKGQMIAAGRALTINDPGNAARAITVGSTHRFMPYTYGVSYFSSKGPTGDGRAKPDLIAPGEKVLSAGTGSLLPRGEQGVHYVESTGTSMAAPHVSGAIASFLSIRPEFIGRPEDVKRIFLNSATDLGRVPEFQGHGLLDIMRAIQSV